MQYSRWYRNNLQNSYTPTTLTTQPAFEGAAESFLPDGGQQAICAAASGPPPKKRAFPKVEYAGSLVLWSARGALDRPVERATVAPNRPLPTSRHAPPPSCPTASKSRR